MLSTNRKHPTDIILLSICYDTTVKELKKVYKMSLPALKLLILIHGLQRIFNRYLSNGDLLPICDYSYVALNKNIKVLVRAGLLERVKGRYNVTLSGLDLIRAYDTRISRKYIELTEKHRDEWRYIPTKKKEQKKNKQFPPLVDRRNQ